MYRGEIPGFFFGEFACFFTNFAVVMDFVFGEVLGEFDCFGEHGGKIYDIHTC